MDDLGSVVEANHEEWDVLEDAELCEVLLVELLDDCGLFDWLGLFVRDHVPWISVSDKLHVDHGLSAGGCCLNSFCSVLVHLLRVIIPAN